MTSGSISSTVERASTSSSNRRWFLSYSNAVIWSCPSSTLLSPWRRNTAPSLRLAMTWSVEALTSRTRTTSSPPWELVTGSLTGFTMGIGSQQMSGICSKSSMACAPSRANPVTSPPSSMPMASFPPAAFESATTCLAASLGLIRALLRSKYWLSFASEKSSGSFWPIGFCMAPPMSCSDHSTATASRGSRPASGPVLWVSDTPATPGICADPLSSPRRRNPAGTSREKTLGPLVPTSMA